MTTRRILLSAAFALGVAVLTVAPQLAAQDLAIRYATLLTITNGDITNGNVVVRGGKITAVGRNAAIPAGIPVIDGTGKFVMPGLIDAHSHAALEGGINESSESVTPEVVVQVNNQDQTIYRSLAGGVTAALLLSSAMLMKVDTPTRLFGYPVLAVVLFLVAAALGLAIALSALLRDRRARPNEQQGPH